MGRITYTNDHCARAWDGTYDGVMTFMAPDGSNVVTTYTGTITPDFAAEVWVSSCDFVIIVGGTRRFAGASGGGPGGARLAWADQEALFTGQTFLREWIDGHIVYAPGNALGR